MSGNAPVYAQNIGQYMQGVARDAKAFECLGKSIQTQPSDWRELAKLRLQLRQTSLLDVMTDAELQAIEAGQIDLWQIHQGVAQDQALHARVDHSEAVNFVNPEILALLEGIAIQQFRHTLVANQRDQHDFFEVHVTALKVALLNAFWAGMRFRSHRTAA